MFHDGYSVLVVDNEPDMLETLSDILSSIGYNPTVVSDARKAIELVEEVHFDVVLLDIGMPEMNGVEAYYRIKEKKADIRVVMMTGYGAEHPLVKQVANQGVGALLHKPFNMSELMDSIDRVRIK